jgi:hypothetical protein
MTKIIIVICRLTFYPEIYLPLGDLMKKTDFFSRRSFFKLGLIGTGAILTWYKGKIGLTNIFAAEGGAGGDLDKSVLGTSGYVHKLDFEGENPKNADGKKYKKHLGQLSKKIAKLPAANDKAKTAHPSCENCKHFNNPKDKKDKLFVGDWGHCAMVKAIGDVKVSKTGWCEVWSGDKKKIGLLYSSGKKK